MSNVLSRIHPGLVLVALFVVGIGGTVTGLMLLQGPNPLSEDTIRTTRLAESVLEVHPRGREDVTCFILDSLHGPPSISCVKETRVQSEVVK